LSFLHVLEMAHSVFPEHERDWLLFTCQCFNSPYLNKNKFLLKCSVYSGFCFGGGVAPWCIGNFWSLALNMLSQTRDKLQYHYRVMNWSMWQAFIQSFLEKLQLSARSLPHKCMLC
jgi:hypothetical protein